MAAPAPGSSGMESQVQSAMPLPVMQYVKQYTNQAVAEGYAPKPPPPIQDNYMMFGQKCHQDDVIIRPLESQGLSRLHPYDCNRKEELKKQVISIACNFLDLLDVLVSSSSSAARDDKIDDLNLLFISVHHLINEFRPHQARETLKVMMGMQKKKMVESRDQLTEHMQKAQDILTKCQEQLSLIDNQEMGVNDVMESAMEVEGFLTTSSLPSTPSQPSVTSGSNNVNDYEKDMIMAGILDGTADD